MIRQKDSAINHCISKNINDMREVERKKRIQLYGEVEEQRQKVTSALMLELMQICQNDLTVPQYIHAIAKVLDNYQGKLNNQFSITIFWQNEFSLKNTTAIEIIAKLIISVLCCLFGG